MKNEGLFKGIFIGATILFIGLSVVIGAFFLMSIGFSMSGNGTMSQDDRIALVILSFAMFLVLVFLIIVGVLVFKDAKKIGLNPWLWILVTMYTPNGIGIIIYLIVRYNEAKSIHCKKCNRKLEAGFNICPYCGTDI